MIDRLGDRLPKFTDEEMKVVHGSSEFYGCNTCACLAFHTLSLIRSDFSFSFQTPPT